MIELKAAVLEILQYAVAAILPIIGALIGNLLFSFSKKIKNDALRSLAHQAVLFAEDKLGPDTNLGAGKLQIAVDFLVENTKLSREQAETYVRAAYQNIFAPFKKAATS